MENNLENYHLISTNESDNSIVEIYEINDKDIKRERQNLINLYDVIYEISDNLEFRGVDTSSWFYKNTQISDMKKNKNLKFI